MREIMRSVHGSHLYGLNRPESDEDFKGIFIPPIQDLLLRRAPKEINNSTGDKHEKNQAGDIDINLFILDYFIKLAADGEIICIDMLHTPDDFLIIDSDIWQYIRENRSRFYTKSMKAFTGYAKKQAAKYGIKGSRMGALEEVYNVVQHEGFMSAEGKKLEFLLARLPENEFCNHIEEENKSGDTQKFYEVLGSKYQYTMPLRDFVIAIRKKWKSYGERARLAKENSGIDWKAVSHALRAAYQLEDIFGRGDIIFPFEGERKKFLMDVKQGKLDFLSEVQPELEERISRVEVLSEQSDLPETCDMQFWEDFILNTYKKEFGI